MQLKRTTLAWRKGTRLRRIALRDLLSQAPNRAKARLAERGPSRTDHHGARPGNEMGRLKGGGTSDDHR
jgi:hypothetical protein